MLENTNYKWQTKTFNSGRRIFLDTDILYLIKKGAVKITTYDLSGKIIILGYWGKGDVIGQSLTQIKPYEIECLNSVNVDCVPYQDWHLVAREIRNCYQDAEKLLYILKQTSIEDKLIELLVYLGGKFGTSEEKGKAISLPLTHRELAEFFGVTRANIVAAINRLQKRNILENPRQGVIILHASEVASLEYQI